MDIYEVTYIEAAKSFQWTEKKCRKEFGSAEWEEIKAGYLPHIVAVKIS